MLAVVVLAAGCARRSTPAPQPPPDPVAVASLSRAVLAADEGQRLVEDAFDRLFAAPEVTAAGERLLQRLGDAPRLQPSYEAYLGDLLASPAFMAAVVRVASSEPGRSPEQIADSLAARVDAAFESPELDAAFDAVMDELFERPAIDRATERLGGDLVDRSGAVQTIAKLALAWRPDLEAAVGVSMDAPSFEARFEAYMDEPRRAAAVSRVISENMATDPRMVAAVAGLVDGAGMLEITADCIHDVLEAPGFRDATIEVLAALIEGRDRAALQAELQRLLERPEVEAAIVRWFQGLGELRETATLSTALGEIFADPAVQAQLYAALIGVPRGRTA